MPVSNRRPEEILPADRFSPRQLLVLFVCFLAAMIDGFDIMIVPFTAPAIIEDWAVSSQEIGLLFSAGLLGMALGSMLLGSLADIYGRRPAITLAMLVAGLATSATFIATDIAQVIALRAVAGIGLGILIATLPTMVGEFSPSRYRTLTISILLTGISVGGVVGGLIVAEVIADTGWRGIFLYAGLLTSAGSVVFYLLVPESMAFIAKRRPAVALAAINRILHSLRHPQVSELPSNSTATTESATVLSLLTPSRRKTTLMAWSTFLLAFALLYFVSSWMPNILVNGGLSQEAAIRGTVFIALGGIAGTLLIGWLSRWWALNGWIALFFSIGTALLVAFSVLQGDLAAVPPLLLLLILFALGVTINGGNANLYGLAVIVYPVQVRSTGLGWCAGLGRLGAVLSTTLVGVLLGIGVTTSQLFFGFAGAAILAALGAWAVGSRALD